MDPAELAVLAEMGFETVIGAVAASGPTTYLVELYGDDRSLPAADFASALRLAVRAAMPPRRGGADLAIVRDPAA